MAYYWSKNGCVMDRESRRNESKAFFTNLRRLAERNDLTNNELANVLGISPTYISKYIRGDIVPREEAFESIKKHAIDFFDMSVTDIINGDFEEDHEEVVVAEPEKEKEEDGTNSFAIEWTETAMRLAIQQRRDRITLLEKEIDALELALTLMKEDQIL